MPTSPTHTADDTGRSVPRSRQNVLLHVFPSFGPGGVPLRMCRVINHFGQSFRHIIIALDGNIEAACQISPDLDVEVITRRLRRGMLTSIFASLGTLRQIRPDLLLTYNWGSIEWAMANRLWPASPHVHLEAGFGKEEADAQLRRRILARRWALARCRRVVVPSRQLERLARETWKLRPELVIYLPNGVDLRRFSAPSRDQIPGLVRRPGELVIGTLAPLRPEKNVGRLIRAFARVHDTIPVRLVVAGDGIERAWLEGLTKQLGIAGSVIFTGHVRPEAVLGGFDLFALSSDTEQMPNALLEAMAAGLAVAAVDVGDVKEIVSEENRAFIVPRDDDIAFADAIRTLLCDHSKRGRLAQQNRERAASEFSQDRMLAGYSAVFSLATASHVTRAELLHA